MQLRSVEQGIKDYLYKLIQGRKDHLDEEDHIDVDEAVKVIDDLFEVEFKYRDYKGEYT